MGAELRELTGHFPDHKDPTVNGGSAERRRARQSLKEVVLSLRRVGLAAAAGDFDAATLEYSNYRNQIQNAVPYVNKAQSLSLFDPGIHQMHYTALRKVSESATPAPH